ncbi:winged helix-turn-helix transcriptional regulator [Natronorubrum sp. JWXQ-INN-674]|uniref:Winged helix-turn-helix transcriptional regulator n=1 Tax=Natronorubrum halalkaliphilum TaxID=2691917 RepID=A0A6B0VQ66_9EURY|nr:helix-turn-helix domain-containing protein [Natronorubrum halalkaliphilum]MXV63166.1 winged helix-turn-helix transcriptional regulator [Natronorubrum halalkaliphilum]
MASDDTDERRVDDGDREGDGEGEGYEYEPDERVDETETLEALDALDALEDDGDNDGVRTAAVEEVDQRIVDLLSWILDTETRAKIYVHLLAHPGSTSEEVAQGTGLYPSTVREALAELHEEDRVTREKRASEGAGNNPYEYTAIQPSELVGGVVDQVQQELNTIFTLDRVLDRQSESASETELEGDAEPVTITVDDTEPPEPDAADEAPADDVDDEPPENASDRTDIELVGENDPEAPDGDDEQ